MANGQKNIPIGKNSDGDIVGNCRCDFVEIHAEASVTCDENCRIIACHLCANGSTKTEAHSSKTAA